MMVPILLAITSHWWLNLAVHLFSKILSRQTVNFHFCHTMPEKNRSEKKQRQSDTVFHVVRCPTLMLHFFPCQCYWWSWEASGEALHFDTSLLAFDIRLERFPVG